MASESHDWRRTKLFRDGIWVVKEEQCEECGLERYGLYRRTRRSRFVHAADQAGFWLVLGLCAGALVLTGVGVVVFFLRLGLVALAGP